MVKLKHAELLKRATSTLVLVPIIVFLLVDASGAGFVLLLMMSGCIALYELSVMSHTALSTHLIINVLMMVLFFYLMNGMPVEYFFLIWLSIFRLFYVFRQRWVYSFLYNGLIASAWVFSIALWQLYHWSLVIALSLIWSVDIAQYCVGRCIGHYPLCQSISPNKTIEGAVAGCVVGLAWPWLPIQGLFVAIGAIVGDLIESRLKRMFNTKDSGDIVPGHGGLLDRLDSIIVGLPIYYLLIKLGVSS